jgi:sulfur-oxidizing protein SoxZ
MAAIKPRIKAPKSVAAGEVFTVKTLINHDMESGQRKGSDGNKIPRQILHTMEVTFNGALVMKANQHGSISANPYVEFDMKVNEAGTLAFKWLDDDGSVYEGSADIAIG